MKDIRSMVNARDIRRDQITLLVTTYYDKFEFLRYEPLSLLIDKSLKLFLDTELSIEEVNNKLMDAVVERKRVLDERYDSIKILKNHEVLYGRLEQLIRYMNEVGLDYFLAGALTGYLKYQEESNRCHDDIDICLNEEDIDSFRKIVLSLGLFFEDARMNSPRVLKNGIPSGEHEVIARDPNSDFHIGVFCFERLPDHTIIHKGYYHNEDGESCCREEVFYKELASIIFGGEEIDFRGTPIKIIPPEYVYSLKEYTKQPKDVDDIEFLKDKIDSQLLNRLKDLSHIQKEIRYVPVYHVVSKVDENPFQEDDLGLILVDDDAKNNKAKVKKREDGFASNVMINSLVLFALSLSIIAIAVLYLLEH